MKNLKLFFILALLSFGNAAVRIVKIGTNFPNPVGIEYHQATNTILISTNYPSGQPKNFARIEFDGTNVPFSDISGLTEEVKISCVRQNNIPNNLFLVGECFTGSGASGGVTRIAPDGSSIIKTWVQLPNDPGLLRGSLYVDNWGVVGGQLGIVTTSGWAFLVDGNKNVLTLGSTGVHLEGLVIVPDNPAQYGPTIAAKMIAGAEGQGNIWIFDPIPPISPPVAVPARSNTGAVVRVEDLDFIFPGENWFGINYAQGRLVGASAVDFIPYQNQILITMEFVGLFVLDWRSGSPVIVSLPQDQSALVGNGGIVNQYEHTTFAKAGILEIPPGDPICYLWRDRGASFNFDPIRISAKVIDFYNYNSNSHPSSSNFFTGTVTTTPDISAVSFGATLTILPVIDLQNIISLVFQADSFSSGNPGSVELQITTTGYQPSIGANMRVADDSTASPLNDFADTISWSGSAGYFSWRWGATTSDGAVISPILVAGLNQGICFGLKVVSFSGINNIRLLYANGNAFAQRSVALPTDQIITMCVYDCNKLCFLFDECTGCAASNCTWCDGDQKCVQPTTTCARGPAYNTSTGLCPCDRYNSSCGKCSENPNCGWCCLNGGISGNCLSGTAGNGASCSGIGGTWNYHTCTGTCASPCARGACVCGQCQCPNGWTGPTCDILIGCDGVPGSGLVYDACSICGGNGTTCLGCDGKPNGPSYDNCGVCGGDGSSCFQICPFTTCDVCSRAVEFCEWCYNAASGFDGVCLNKGTPCPSGSNETNPNSDRCQKKLLSTPALAATISAGIVAVIVIAIIICLILAAVGGGGAYKVYMKNKRVMAEIQSNPLYVESAHQGTNPIFEDRH